MLVRRLLDRPVTGLAFALGVVGWTGCASEVAGLGSGGSGGDVATTQVASGSGQTGQTGSGGGCAEDCSTITTPPCLMAVCNEGAYEGTIGACVVVNSPKGTPCDDGKFCTVDDTCDGGVCVGGPPNDCGMTPPQCTGFACNESTKTCSPVPAGDGTPCTSNDLCQANAICQNGLCVGSPKDCTFSPLNECDDVTCNPQTGACEGTPSAAKNGDPCNLTGDLCQVDKTCLNGTCSGGTPKDCSMYTNGCNVGMCNAGNGSCFADPIPPGGQCFDGIGSCQVGVCSNGGTCDPMPAMEGSSCDDGNACTTNDLCTNGTCAGTNDPGYTVYFQDSFANNAAGWALDADWGIGAAAASSCGDIETGDDPATDHTSTSDNGEAGVVIGGCYPTSLHGDYCMTSPVIDLSAAAGPVFFSYWRHLHSDYPIYVTSTVDVSSDGGTTWTNLYAVAPGEFQDDLDWTSAQFDITAYKTANTKVRFCYSVGSSGLFEGGGWNIDDVTIASAFCP